MMQEEQRVIIEEVQNQEFDDRISNQSDDDEQN